MPAIKKDATQTGDGAETGANAQNEPVSPGTELEDWQARAQAAEDALAKLGAQAPVKGANLPPFFLVRLTHPDTRNKLIFRSVSEKRARAYLTRFFPRGSEAYLELPDGSMEHHEMERSGEFGTDADVWAPFNPASWQPPSEIVPPGESAWADREG